MKIVREKVKVIINPVGGVYEAIDNGKFLRINIEQVESVDGSTVVKRLHWDTDISTFKPGDILPGNIIRCYSLTPLTDNINDHILTDNRNNPIETTDGHQVYTYLVYVQDMPYLRWGVIDEDIKSLLG
jgi:hypothetical protein